MRPCVPWYVVRVCCPHPKSGGTVPNYPPCPLALHPSTLCPHPEAPSLGVPLNLGGTQLLQNSVLRRRPTPQAHGPQGTGGTGCRASSLHVLLPLSQRPRKRGWGSPERGPGWLSSVRALRAARPGVSGSRK